MTVKRVPQSVLNGVETAVIEMENHGRNETQKDLIVRLIMENFSTRRYTSVPPFFDEAESEFWLGVARALNSVQSRAPDRHCAHPFWYIVQTGKHQVLGYLRRVCRNTISVSCECGHVGRPRFVKAGILVCFACGSQEVKHGSLEVSLSDFSDKTTRKEDPVETSYLSVLKQDIVETGNFGKTRGKIFGYLVSGIRDSVPNYVTHLTQELGVSKQNICRHVKAIRGHIMSNYDVFPEYAGILME